MNRQYESFTRDQRQCYQGIYSKGFGTDSSQFFSKNLYFPRTQFDMAYGQGYLPDGAIGPQPLKDGCCGDNGGSRYDGQRFKAVEGYRHRKGVVSGRWLSGV